MRRRGRGREAASVRFGAGQLYRHPCPHPVSGEAGAERGGGANDGDDDDGEMLRHVANMESRPDTFRSMTSLNVDEARELYQEALSAAAAQAARDGRKRRRGGGRGWGGEAPAQGSAPRAPRAAGGAEERGVDVPAQDFMPYAEFLMALMMVRKDDGLLVDFMFRAPKGTARAAFDAALPVLFELRGMPRRFARRLVPFGYKMPPTPKSRRGIRNILDYT